MRARRRRVLTRGVCASTIRHSHEPGPAPGPERSCRDRHAGARRGRHQPAAAPGRGIAQAAARGLRHRRRAGYARLRVRRPQRLSRASDDRGAAARYRRGEPRARALPRARRQDRAARCRHRALRRGAAARRRGHRGFRQAQPDPRDRHRQPLRRGPARRGQPRHQHGGGPPRLLLRARPLQPDRLLDRRQCRREFRRCALPQVRAYHQQPARRRDGADGRRDPAPRRQAVRCRGLRPARCGDRARRGCSAR